MKIAGIVVGVLLAVFAVAYLTSDVFSTKVNQTAEQWSKWTPENIQKDPAGYLAFAKQELEAARDKLEARQIAIKTKENTYKRKLTEATVKKTEREKLLDELHGKYSEAKNSNSTAAFPLTINGRELDEKTLKKVAVKTNKELKHQKKLVDTYTAFYIKLNAQVTKLEDQLEKLSEKRDELALQTEVVLLKLEINKLNDLNDGLMAVFDTSVALAGEPDAIDPEDLIAPGGETAVDTKFDELGW